MTFLWFIFILLGSFLVGLVGLISKKDSQALLKWGHFECGFNSMSLARIPFSIQFFFIAILFLIFDIEVAILVSFPMEFSGVKKALVVLLILTILVIALLYEWYGSKIDWSKWMG